MVDFVQLQRLVKERLDQDRTVHAVEAEGSTLEAAVAEAALLLNVPVRRMEYEIIERGSSGIWGMGKKGWKISAYERFFAEEMEAFEESLPEDAESGAALPESRDGGVFIQLHEGVYLKVTPPVEKGKWATESQVMKALADRSVQDVERETIAAVVKEAAGSYVKIGKVDHNIANDASMTVKIADQEMKAYIKVTPPGPGGYDITAEAYLNFLRNNRIVYGVSEEFVRNFADKPTFYEEVLIAEGSTVHNGRDAYLRYNFETDPSKVHLREGPDGRIDFKELNIIQNVVEGQPLARKIRAEAGIPGRTVTGKVLPAVDGKDVPLPLGKGVHVGEDGETIIADTNGQVLMVAEKINVEPVFTVQGNVNLKTGNIIFLGSVIITGNVEDGFTVKAAGNIEVNGTVERAELDAEGDITVHQGIAGKGAGTVKAGRSIWARFIENTNIEAGDMVVVSDGIINSQVDAHKRIICQGKRATIVGGRLRATEEINAKIIGNPTSGTVTICEVGFDPSSKEQLDKLIVDKESIEKDLDDVQLALQNLINIKKQRKSLPDEKELELRELMDRRQDLSVELENINGETVRIQKFLDNLKIRGRVSASAKVYPGVKIIIRDIKEDVRNEYRAVTFILENDLIRVTKYEEPEEVEEPGD